MADNTAELVAQPAVYLIWKQGAYYRPNSHGYTTSAIQAGRYTLADAISITHPNGPDGPRDGMGYVHEGEVIDRDWQAYQAQAAEIARLTDEGAALAAWQCVFTDGVTGLACDEYGGQVCQMQRRAEKAEAALAAAEARANLRDVAKEGE